MKPTPWAMRLADDLQQQFIIGLLVDVTDDTIDEPRDIQQERDRQYEMALVIDRAAKMRWKWTPTKEDTYEARWCPANKVAFGTGYLGSGDGVCSKDIWRNVSVTQYNRLRAKGIRVRKNGRRTTKR